MEEILSKIIIRKGAGNPPALDIGEFGLDTTNQKLHVGTVNGNKEVAMKDDIPAPQTFKTINNQPIIGEGNISITAGGGGGITAFVGTREEYNVANAAEQIASGTLVIITDEEEIPNSSTTAVLGVAELGSMILGHQ